MNPCDVTDKVKQLLRAMARAKIEEGHTDPDTIISHIHEAIKDHAPLERSDIADIIASKPSEKATKSDLQKRVEAFYKELRDRQKVPPDTNALKNQARQRVIEKEIKKLEARIAAGDFRKAEPRQSYLRTTETEKAQARLNKLRADWEKGQRMAQAANRSKSEKVADMIVELHRAAVLTSPNVLLKLPATALSNIALRPVLETAGQGWRKLLPSIAAKAAGEGGAGGLAGVEATTLKKTFSKETAQATWQKLTTGTHELESLYSKKAKHDDFQSDFALTQVIGNIHGALKVPAAINQWTRSMQHRMASEADGLRRAGKSEDEIATHLADPATKARIAAEAWADGEREIFQNPNMLSDAYSALLGRLRTSAEAGNTGAKALEKTARFFLPITKVPTNITIAASSYAGGALGAIAQIAHAARIGAKEVRAGRAVDEGIWKNAVNALTPAQADSIMRNLKRQTVGAAAMAIGAYFYKNFGGMYQQGDSRNRNKPDSETIKIGGYNISKQVLEHPLLTAMQLGATVMWVENKPKGDKVSGIFAAAKGLAEKNPFINEARTIGEGFSSLKEFEKFAGNTVSSMNPQAIQWIARNMDRDSTGKLIKRSPKNFQQEIEQGVPGARNYVPRSPNQ